MTRKKNEHGNCHISILFILIIILLVFGKREERKSRNKQVRNQKIREIIYVKTLLFILK